MSYLSELDAALVGPRRVRRDLLQEAADHLDDATEAYVDAGLERVDARARAEHDFGPVRDVASAFQTTLAVSASRRTSGLLLAALVLQPFLWDNGVGLASTARASAPDAWWYAVLDAGLEAAGAVVIVGAVLGLAATSIGNRWLPAGRVIARAIATFTLVSAVVVPLIVASTLVATAPDPLLWLLAATLLGAPLSLAAVSGLATLRASLRPERAAG